MFPGRLAALLMCLALVLAAACPAWAGKGRQLLAQGVEHYEFAEFKAASASLDKALATGELGPREQAQAHLYLGLVALAQGDEQKGAASFAQAKRLDPGLQLDPGRFPPKAVRMFASAGQPAKPPATEPPAPAPPAGRPHGFTPKAAPAPTPITQAAPAPAPAPATEPPTPAPPAGRPHGFTPKAAPAPTPITQAAPAPAPATEPPTPAPPAGRPHGFTPKAAPAPTPATQPAPAPRPAPAQAPAPAPAPAATGQPAQHRPARGYLLEVSGASATIDLGQGQKVRPGDRYQVVRVKELVHPVTGKRLSKLEPVGLIEISQVQPDVSLARVLSGAGKIAPGMRITKVASAPARKPPAGAARAGKAMARAAGPVRLAVMQPTVDMFGQSTRFDAEDYRAGPVAKALQGLPGLKPAAVSPARMKELETCCNFRPGAYVLGKTLSLTSLERIKDIKLLAALSAEQVARLGEVMKRLQVDAVLVWTVTLEESGTVTIACNLFRKGQADPEVRDSVNQAEYAVTKGYPRLLAEMVRAGLTQR